MNTLFYCSTFCLICLISFAVYLYISEMDTYNIWLTPGLTPRITSWNAASAFEDSHIENLHIILFRNNRVFTVKDMSDVNGEKRNTSASFDMIHFINKTAKNILIRDNEINGSLTNIDILRVTFTWNILSFPREISGPPINYYHQFIVSPNICSVRKEVENVMCSDISSDYPLFKTIKYDGNTFNMSMYVIYQGVVNKEGYVRSIDVDIAPNSCLTTPFSMNKGKLIKQSNSLKCYKEVFVISQPYGQAYYHFNLENLPRLVPNIAFLLRNQHVKIHIKQKTLFYVILFKVLDLDPGRVVLGDICANIIYLPQSTGCCKMPSFPGQLLSLYYRNFTKTNLIPPTDASNHTMILLKRTKMRQLLNSDDVYALMASMAPRYGLVLHVFADNPVPSMETTMKIFYNAALVVGPHGAGLSNLVFSNPGAYVLEIHCKAEYGPRTLYATIAKDLGHYYYGILATSGCEKGMYANITEVKDALQIMLDHYISHVNVD